MLDAGAEADAVDQEGKSPIYWHASADAIVSILLDRGADPARTATLGGATPLHRAAEAESAESVRLLLAAGAPVDLRTSKKSYFPGRTALHAAASTNSVEAARVLLDHGAAIDATDHGREGYSAEGGDTPLHLACEEGYVEVIELLLARGADPEIENARGRTPRDVAEAEGSSEVIALFSR